MIKVSPEYIYMYLIMDIKHIYWVGLIKSWVFILLVFNVYQPMLVSIRKIKNKKEEKQNLMLMIAEQSE